MAKNNNRDDFSPVTKRAIERQARGHCSDPMCRRLTHGATSDGADEVRIGKAAHIRAAAPGGPRYDPYMTPEDRRSADNGIWLCDVHARAIDSNDPKFTVELLRDWKKKTDEDSWRSVMHNVPYGPGMRAASPDEMEGRLRSAAKADLEVFRRTAKWPATTVTLTLKVNHIPETLSTRALANAVTTLDDLILIAPPGMGKTTTIFQIAEGVLQTERGLPLVVPLGDWATESASLLHSILGRPAFREVSEADFRVVAAKPGVVLLLDGWNELDAAARERARVQVTALKAELPELGLVVSARKQALDVPFAGTFVDLLPLNDEQQMEIAKALRGESGEKLLDQAWRTAGVGELVTIPLYLTSLLALPEGAPFPTTKEEILRRFVAAHEEEARRAEALRAAIYGLQREYLNGLAVLATSTANTAISDSNARRSISGTSRMLIEDGQITMAAQPGGVLDILVSNHVLMRSGDTPGYSFQHQQFQEWYASHYVESLMAEAVSKLKADVLDLRPWEEAILFAVERMARGDHLQQEACGAAILAALDVDPMLAAEMVFRSTDVVWELVSAEIQSFARKWHTPNKVDRAFRFMITSGRSEFLDLVWPLITHEDSQVLLPALRAGRRFRPSLLGSAAQTRIAALASKTRVSLLHEIVFNSGIDGLNLATAVAKTDEDPEVVVSVIEALVFRRAHRHIVELLSTADDKIYDLVIAKAFLDENDVRDEAIKKRLEAARGRESTEGISHHERLRRLVYAHGDGARDAEVTDVVASVEIDRSRQDDAHLLYEAHRRYPRAVAEGLLRRLRDSRAVFYGAGDILAAAGIVLEDDGLLEIVLAEGKWLDSRAEAAASVLGPRTVGRLIEAYLEAGKDLRDEDGKYDEVTGNRYHTLRDRLGHTPGTSLVGAVQARAASATNEEIWEFAELLSRPVGEGSRARPFSAENLSAMGAMAKEWGERMLAAGDASRGQLASIAELISHAPSVTLLPLLKKLLDDNLRRFRAFREEAKAVGWRQDKALDEACSPHTHHYQQAFIAIEAAETTGLMEGYLTDEHFGQLAATVLAVQWTKANEADGERKFHGSVDFSRLEERRAARIANPAKTSVQAEHIFRAIGSLLADGSTDEEKKLAVELGVVGARLPHGRRDDTVRKLILLAPRPARAALLLGLVLSGEEIEIDTVAAGVAEVLEAAKKERWILEQSDAYQLKEWLRLLPFANRLSDIPAIVRTLPDAQRNPNFLEEMVRGFAFSPFEEAGEVLFKLAEGDPRFYRNFDWRATIMRFGAAFVACRFIDLAADATFDGLSSSDWHHLVRELGGLIVQFAEARSHAYELVKKELAPRSLALLAEAIAENPDAEGLLILIDLEIKHGRSFVSWSTVENTVAERVPVEDWNNAYSIVPVPVIELRKKLLAKTTNSGPNDRAARGLDLIDQIRDCYGAPEAEPRHPDLASGRRWPFTNSSLYAD